MGRSRSRYRVTAAQRSSTLSLPNFSQSASARTRASMASATTPAAGVVAEAMLALVLADALCEKFGNDNVDDLCAAVERYRRRLHPIDQRR